MYILRSVNSFGKVETDLRENKLLANIRCSTVLVGVLMAVESKCNLGWASWIQTVIITLLIFVL